MAERFPRDPVAVFEIAAEVALFQVAPKIPAIPGISEEFLPAEAHPVRT